MPLAAICGLGVLASFCISLPVARRLRRVSWDSCPATRVEIKTGSVHAIQRRKDPFHATLCYTYFVNGRCYSSHHGRDFETEVQAWKFVARQIGKRVLSHYKPENPNESLLML
jgi:hypothetical protein